MTTSPPTACSAYEALSPRVRIGLRTLLVAMAVVGLTALVLRSVGDDATEPGDLGINLVAAERLVDGRTLYESTESRQLAVERSGGRAQGLYHEPTTSFVGPPGTALLHVPWLVPDHELGVALFRLTTIGGLVTALGLVARCLPKGVRIDGFLLGLGAVTVSPAAAEMIDKGQGHHLVMLGLALAIWGVARERWWVVGVGIGVAAVLKLAPVIVIVYLVARGRTAVIPGFVATVGALVVMPILAGGRPGDVLTWVAEVLPHLSEGVVRTSNQSLPAALHRLVAAPGELTGGAGVGAVRLIAVPLLVVGAAGLWVGRRTAPVAPQEVGALVLLGLAVGPLTWIHYVTWASLALVLAITTTRRSALVALSVVVVLLALPVLRPSADAVAATWGLRVVTNPALAAVLILLATCTVDLVAGARPARGDTGRTVHRGAGTWRGTLSTTPIR